MKVITKEQLKALRALDRPNTGKPIKFNRDRFLANAKEVVSNYKKEMGIWGQELRR